MPLPSTILLALLVALPVRAKEFTCTSPLGAAVPSVRTARAIAKAVIASRPVKLRGFSLNVGRSGDGWEASQSLSPTRPTRNADGQLIATFGGGGLHMHIDGCTGEISNMYYLR